MPLPMVHLGVALEICRVAGCEVCPDYLLGAIAPDAIHMRPDSTTADKWRVHFIQAMREQGIAPIRALLEKRIREKPEQRNLMIGYATHLMTDECWVRKLLLPFRTAVCDGLSSEEERTLYYHETDEIDRLLYLHMPWRPQVWALLARAQPQDLVDLLTSEEIGAWRDRTLIWFDNLATADDAPQYFTYDRVMAFIEHTGKTIAQDLIFWDYVPDKGC